MVFTIVSFAFKKHERSEFIVAFGGFEGLSPEQGHGWEFITVVKKYPLYPCLFLFKPLISFLRLKKLPLD